MLIHGNIYRLVFGIPKEESLDEPGIIKVLERYLQNEKKDTT
jgi:hypothetical protein